MTNIKDIPFHSLQFYATAPYACSYLVDHEARSQVATPPQRIDSKVYSELIRAGFRRSGHFTYRPHCDQCQACIATRVQVPYFIPNRSQRRAFLKHANLQAKVMALEFIPEHYELYRAYQESRHADQIDGTPAESGEDEEDQYRQFLIQSHIDSFLVEFRENGVLRMVSVIDAVMDGLSSVYTFYDASQTKASYGTYGILWQINKAKELQLPFVYLGYYIKESQKMSYKFSYKPIEGLIDGAWTILDDITAKPTQ
jgi:arginine-tRNA-protein transferase